MFGLLHTNVASYPGSFARKEEMSPWTRLMQTSHLACMGFWQSHSVLHITQDTAQRIWSWNRTKIVMYTGQLHSTVHFPAPVFNSQLKNVTKPVLQRNHQRLYRKSLIPSTLWPEGVWVSETNYVHKDYFCTAVQLVISNFVLGVWISENSKLIMQLKLR